MKNYITHGLMFGALFLGAGLANAQDVYLCAKQTSKSLPDGSTVPMWGYAEDDNADLSDGCGTGIVQIPGPELTPVGGALTVHLLNNLPEPTSIVIPGQAMPTSLGGSPTWNDNTTGPRTGPTQRVRSFGAEAAPGSVESYAWTGLDAGTLMYHSGTHPQKQLYMGLYGAITGDAGVVVDNEIVLFYSVIDPVLNASIADNNYETSIQYHAMWFLVNGEPYVEGATADIPAGEAGPVSYTHLTLPTNVQQCRSRWSPYH